MEYKKSLTVGLLIFFSFINYISHADSHNSQKDTLTVLSTRELYNLSKTLVEAFSATYSGTEFQVRRVGASELEDKAGEAMDVGFTGREVNLAETDSFLNLLIGRNFIVPVINAQNPFADLMDRRGVSPDVLAKLFQQEGAVNWGDLTGKDEEVAVPFFVADEPAVRAALSAFLKVDTVRFKKLTARPSKDLVAAVQDDRYAIGFCWLTDVLDARKQGLAENIKLLPLDQDGNGAIDFTENIYASPEDFKRGAGLGKYPEALVRDIYTVIAASGENGTLTDFAGWLLTDGQRFMKRSGYTGPVK